ncbi:MAG: hypothetical protein HQL42_16160 [Alphaproteobacteria bacterium]|nr:hypothetical protein [Alphaproteobacteria bacterium]
MLGFRHLLFVCGFVLGILLHQPAMAQTSDPEAIKAQQLREQNIRDFQIWREAIPDYEKRLYDRVQKINQRVIELQRIVVAGAVVTIVLLFGIGAYLWMFSAVRGTGPAAVSPSSPDWIHSLPDKLRMQSALRHQRMIRRRQAQLAESLRRVEAHVSASNQDARRFQELLVQLKMQSDVLERDIAHGHDGTG